MADKAGVDPELLKNLKSYLSRAAPPVLNGDAQVFRVALDEKEAEEVLRLFAGDGQIPALIIHKNAVEDKEVYTFELQPRPIENKGLSVAFIKGMGGLDVKKPLQEQLQVCQLNDEKPFQVLLAYVRSCFLPYSRSLMATALNDAKKTDSDVGAIRSVNGKLSELEVELLRSQQSVDIPLIQLELHKVVADYIKKGPPLVVSELPNYSDTNFLNELQKRLNEWKKQILQVTTLNRDVDSGTTLEEINFWLGMERAILHIYDQKESAGVEFTFAVLNEAKRFLATTGFVQDVGLSDNKSKDKVYKYSNLLRDLPIKQLLSATDFEQMQTAIEAIFNHLKQIRRIEYPLNRAVKLMHAISRDVVTTVQTTLNAKRPMSLIYDEFEKATKPSENLFVVWDTQLEVFNDELRDLKKSRGEDEDPTTLLTLPYTEFTILRTRITEVRKLRKEHEELRSVVDETLVHDPVTRDSALKAIGDAYQYLREVDVLSISPDGTQNFEAAVRNYKAKIDSVEGDLEATIQRMLDAAKDDANEMFRVCRKFNPLFVRPRIAGTIRKYQEQLIATVKKDIQLLSDKFKLTYANSEDHIVSYVRDVPPVSGSILWARQIERQLEMYLSRVEDVLGKQWVHHVEGRQLKRETDQFKEHLQPLKIMQNWLLEAKQIASFEVESRIFKMHTIHKQVTLAVNFDQKLVTLFKEVRNLDRLGLKVPYEIRIIAHEAREKYPYAMRLDEVIRTYGRTSRLLEEQPDLAPLAAGYKKKVQDSIQAGLFLQWDSERLKKYVETLGTEAVEYQDQVDELMQSAVKVGDALKRLKNAKPADKEAPKAILIEIQTIIDHLDKRGYSNLSDWVFKLNATVEDILVERQKRVLQLWKKALDIELLTEDAQLDLDKAIEEEKARRQKQLERGDIDEDDGASRQALEEKRAAMDFVIKDPVRIRINIRNQMLDIDPPLEHAWLVVTKDLQQWLSVVSELPRLRCFWMDQKREEGGAAGRSREVPTFRSALSRIAPEDLRDSLLKLQSKIAAAHKYVETWLQYQALWDMTLESVTKSLGDDLRKWEKLLLDMKASRATFDNAATEKRFGPLLIDYRSVQTKVNNKYDAWHKDILNKFGDLLNGMIAALYGSLSNGRKTLETYNFDFSTTQNILNSVTLLQDLNKKSKIWSTDLETQKAVEQLLQRQRYVFPQDWIYTDRVQGEWQAFEQILNRKLLKMSKEATTIQAKIAEEEKKLEQRVREIVEDWKQNKPVSGDMDHTQAVQLLKKFDTNLLGLTDELTRLNLAKAALEMPVKEETRLAPVREELDQLQEVWGVLGSSWAKLDQLGEQLFRETKIKDLRKELTNLTNDVQRLPNNMRQYNGYETLRNTIKDYHSACAYLADLNSGILRAKHQKQILQILNMSDQNWRDLTVAQLWKADLKRHQKQIRFILEQAQGESALEEFLLEVASAWEGSKFELADYRGKCFLVRNWDGLFDQLSNNLGDISSMKSSPFYPAFEQEATRWESKLNHAQAIFDIFVDVQRRWVYLEGIFNNSQEVQLQLANQYRKFKTFDTDFVKLMRDIKREDQCDYWVKEERGLLPRMEGYAEVLDGIQKALAEYLEKQRAQFPRFYFVGDDDLLEIIGNSKNVLKIMRHFPKMFAGIEGVKLSEDGNIIEGMISKEGEQVPFKEHINVAEAKSIHEWLHKLEFQMRFSLAALLDDSLKEAEATRKSGAEIDAEKYFKWVDRYPAQIALLSSMVEWSETIESQLTLGQTPTVLLQRVLSTLGLLADKILSPGLEQDRRKKYEQLITDYVHQRDVLRALIEAKVTNPEDYAWTEHMRFYYNKKPKNADKLKITGDKGGISSQLLICISRAAFYYGWEYLGVAERLVQTPLTDRCYLTMTEALHMRLGGNPYGPAGTGKTETVKALGNQLGRFVLVFNCDENFDFNAMGRIFVGLCQCGAWGCFDEFNRLEERILSAVSQQILTIQNGLRTFAKEITLLNKPVALNDNMGVFVTMNPGYAGRSNLPDNLKQLFRGIAMIKPNTVLIGQVMLFSQGFRSAEDLSSKVVMLFSLCDDQLSSQSHYDFGLRALKSVLRSAGNLKRGILQAQQSPEGGKEKADPIYHVDISSLDGEQQILVKSISATIVPKLVSEDIPLFGTLLTAVFPTAKVTAPTDEKLMEKIKVVAKENNYEDEQQWIDKMMQLQEILSIHHGVIMVGPSGTGKSSCWKTLRDATERAYEKKIVPYIIDPKAMTKEELYGVLDSTTLEWTDGVFTHIIRKIIDNVRGEQGKDHWIIFDGDVDPEWAENLNSVLDDNKLLTLPNGERLALTPNMRIMFEVKDLNYATLATVSRCGMVWFSERVVSTQMLLANTWKRLRSENIEQISSTMLARWKKTQEQACDVIQRYFVATESADELSFILNVLDYCQKREHVMAFTTARALMSTAAILKQGIAKIIEYNDNHVDFPMTDDKVRNVMTKYLAYGLMWGMCGDMTLNERIKAGHEFRNFTNSIVIPPANADPLIDWEPVIESGEWRLWQERVITVELEANKVIKPDLVIETVDTTRHTDVLSAWLGDHRPLILCGPPGSGKSMTLTAVLNAMPDFELVTLNFSSTSGIDLILRTLKHYCTCEKTPTGMVMRPQVRNKWLVIFCDEINLPKTDKYQTQRVITFLRQITERGGFWRASDLSFVQLEKVQIIGACNPPTDAGRVVLTPRFLRHCPLMFVDFPSLPSLKQIYGTFNRALLKLQPPLRAYWEPLTDAMIDVYAGSQARFTPDIQPHYIYSPRELSRWVRAMYEAMNPETAGGGITLNLDEMVRLWLHEALRLFSDRLVDASEREWTDRKVNEVARKCFPTADHDKALARPVLFSNWLTKQYISVEQEALREHVKLRLKVFREEELDIKLVIFDEVLEHILRIDRVLQQALGHLLLVGASGGGKTVLSKFVSWMKGMSVFQIKVHKHYKAEDFDKDLRGVLTRSGCHQEKVCFIFDESNVLDSAFLERMNSLLASGEVPGLFEGADWGALMEECKIAANRDNLTLTTENELYKRFCSEVQRNLHVVFTMNPSNEDFDNRSATSPALFNRCVIDWFGEWSSVALYQVGHEFTLKLQLSDAPPGSEDAPKAAQSGYDSGDEEAPKKPMQMGAGTERDNVVSTLVYVHESVFKAMIMLARNTNRRTYVTPRHYLDFIKQYSQLSSEKRSELEEQQRHLNTGLRKLKETQEEVATLRESLQKKDIELKMKEKQANEKLEQIMIDTREAESKRDASEQIAEEIKVQSVGIKQRKDQVEAALANAQPALDEAKEAVSGVKKPDLDQVRGYPSPPAPVKLALEPVVLMLGEKKVPDWTGIRKIVAQNDFIKSILNYNIDLLTEPLRQLIEAKYLADPGFTFEIVNNASKACGPLVKWVASTIAYARIKNSVQPMIDEMTALEAKSQELQRKMDELDKIRKDLADRIESYKREYQGLVGQAQAIKNEMETVKQKVARSESLLANLQVEQERWEIDSKNYEKELNTIVGDCLISAAFLAYIGYFNQSYREMLVSKWTKRLKDLKVRHKPELSIVEYLSHPTERLEWKMHGLPPDNLCVENAIMMKKFNRYPLIIDPSGQATQFLLKQYKERKIVRTSFMDENFLKNLETSLRFGNALLVEDVEQIDPILNSVLNKEIFRQGGRVMITLGDKEIDFSPSFIIFLATRDASCHFTPDLCSRVTFVNFTVTHSSLTTQCLSKILRAERPDIDDKRTDLMRLQGEFRVKLRQLEDQLLNSLSSVRGNILDDDKVMADLENLKSQAADVKRKMEASDKVMEEVEGVSNEYRPFAVVCSSIYFTLESLGQIHFLYQFSLPFFMGIVDKVLSQSGQLKGQGLDPKKRYEELSKNLFQLSYQRVARGLLDRDQVAYAMRLAQLALEEMGGLVFPGSPLNLEEVEFFLKGRTRNSKPPGNYAQSLGLTNAQKLLLGGLISLPAFERLDAHVSSNQPKWREWIDNLEQVEKDSEDIELTPSGWEKSESKSTKLFHQLLATRVLRPDRVPRASRAFVLSVFGANFLDSSAAVDLENIVTNESSADEPLLLVSLPGYDASSKVDSLAEKMKRTDKYDSFAMGSEEGYTLADAAINAASKEGRWVLLKNVHLSPTWLSNLEKRLHRMNHNANFRLFMTMEVNPKVPANLLVMSNVLIFEPPVGLKSALLRSFASMPEARVNRAPVERGRLYFLLAWLHSVVLERLRYAPVGWTKGFEFGESDLLCAMDALDEWIDRAAQGKSNLSPDKIPWDALQALFEKILYGGRIDNEFDQARLVAFVKSLWVPKAYDFEFPLCTSFIEAEKVLKPLIKMPDARDYQGFKAFVQSLPQFQSPEILGLPSNADIMLLTRLGDNIVTSLQALQDVDTGEDVKGEEAGISAGDDAQTREKKKKEKRLSFSLSGEVAADRPAWMVSLEQSTLRWLGQTPPVDTLVPLPTGKKLEELVLNPLFRCVQREYNVFRDILAHVNSDLTLVKDVLGGKIDANNRVRALFLTLKRDGLPEHWVRYGGALKKDPTSLWIPDFAKRVKQMKLIGETGASKYGDLDLWLGGFIAPEAFVAATRQAVAQAHGWSLEELVLKVTVGNTSPNRADSFTFTGLELFGAGWENNALSINNKTLSFKMPPTRFTWVRREEANKDKKAYVRTPVYLDYTREKYLFSVELVRPESIPVELWSQRGTCLTVWGQSA